MDFEAQLEALDPSLFDSIASTSTPADQRSLLALQVACRNAGRRFGWLEIGSHLGGSLQTLVRDPRCGRISSIDPRPNTVPDARIRTCAYPANSTQRMLELLGEIPGADLGIVQTYEAGTDALDPETFEPPNVCFVDGEHTKAACEQDAAFCRRVLRERGLIAFHDVGIVYDGIAAFVERLRAERVRHRTAYLPDSIFVVELGDSKLLDDPVVVSRRLAAGGGVLWLLASNHRYRALLEARRARVLRGLRLLPRVYRD